MPSSASGGPQRGAEREELLAQLEELAAWYRDLVAVAVGAEQRRDPSRQAGGASRRRDAGAPPRRRAAPPRPSARLWRGLEELNLAPQLALEALFVQVAAELGG